MSDYFDKFREGQRLLAQAGNDQAALSMALLKVHSALEDYLRSALATNQAVPEETRQAVTDIRAVQWRDLADYAQKYNVITGPERNTILSFNKLRQNVAHGETITLDREQLEQYVRMIGGKLNIRVEDVPTKPAQSPRTQPPVSAPPRPTAATQPLPKHPYNPYETAVPDKRKKPKAPKNNPPATRPRGCTSWVFGFLLIFFVLSGVRAFQDRFDVIYSEDGDPLRLPKIVDARSTQPESAPVAQPTAAARMATVVDVGNLGLRVRETPSLTGTLVATKLSEGTQVQIIGGPQEADGHTWWQIQTEAITGWCSGTYLQIE
jgi:hypothetical protein